MRMKHYNMKISIVLFTYTFINLLIIHFVSADVQWKDNWAFGCDFNGNDLANVQIRGEDCGGKCASTLGCTHFTWTTFNGGTCWMKQGSTSKSNAASTNDQSMVCGVIDVSSPQPNHIGPTLSNVLATRHDANEVGACELPASGDYTVTNPVALGNIESLQHLKFRPELCGQIFEVNCGKHSLNIIITNSNYGGGLDLYTSTWNKLTNNQPPGQTSCIVKLTSLKTFNFDEPKCFFKPGSDLNNPYYHNVGLLNTNGRQVIKATIDNRSGEHRGDNPYYAFDFGPIDDNKQVNFYLNDGTTHSVFLRDCIKQEKKQYWN